MCSNVCSFVQMESATSCSPIIMLIFASEQTNRTMLIADYPYRKNTFVAHLWLLLFICIFSSCRPSEPETGQGYSAGAESPVITNDISNQQIKAFAEDAQGYICV